VSKQTYTFQTINPSINGLTLNAVQSGLKYSCVSGFRPNDLKLLK